MVSFFEAAGGLAPPEYNHRRLADQIPLRCKAQIDDLLAARLGSIAEVSQGLKVAGFCIDDPPGGSNQGYGPIRVQYLHL